MASKANSKPELSDFASEALEHLPALTGFARRLTRNLSEAEDLVQDTLVKALRAKDQYHAGTNLRAWLLKILKNTFINRYHRGQLERAALSAPSAEPLLDSWMGNASMLALKDPEACALRPQLERQINEAIDELPEEFRIVVLLADVEGFAYREIAETLDCPIGTVMSRLHRGRRLLKSKLLEHARELGLVAPAADTSTSPASNTIDLDSYRAAAGRKG